MSKILELRNNDARSNFDSSVKKAKELQDKYNSFVTIYL